MFVYDILLYYSKIYIYVGDKMEIYLARHCETDWNKRKIVQGRTNIPLNEEGIKQAMELGELLSDIEFDKCYVSPLIRTQQTASYITDLDKIIDERIIERSFGDLEGVENIDFSIIGSIWNFDKDEYNTESLIDVFQRTKDFVDELLNDSSNNILIISHGGSLKGIHYNLIGYDDDTKFNFRLKNGEVVKYILEDGKVKSFEIINKK